MILYYLRHRQRVLGRYSADQLRAMADAGKLTAWHTVSADRQNWVPVSEWESIDAGLPSATEFSISGDKLSSDSARFQLEAVKMESATPIPTKIKVICDCGKAINAPVKYLNKRVKCSQCEQSVLVVPNGAPSLKLYPEAAPASAELHEVTDNVPNKLAKYAGTTNGFSVFFDRIVSKEFTKGAIGVAVVALLAIVFAVWLIYRDTWERDYKSKIVALHHEAETALAQGNKAISCERYEMILDIVDARQLVDARLKEIVATAQRRSAELQSEIAAEADATKKKEDAERAEAERKAQEEADATKKKEDAERAEAEYERYKNKEFLVKVTAMVDAGGDLPLWAADYELRINGKTVETQTTKSTIVTFANIAVKDGDVITVRSGWKNAYGAVLTTYGKIKNGEWPKVKYGQTDYWITIKKD
ncbi:hypothetical protein FACS1894139_10380 [Planctomycetales bacterium]|nr:hypothetical protein FACS1894108_04900 [Planctomycetales bacterium]GHT05830.1 hypothetical protein FACS1894139_10380 [Planctomycetales bacterium]